MMLTGENRSTRRKIRPGAISSTTLLTWGPTRASELKSRRLPAVAMARTSSRCLIYVMYEYFRSHRTHLTLCFG